LSRTSRSASQISGEPVASPRGFLSVRVLQGYVAFPDTSVPCEPQGRRGDCARAGNGFPGNAAPLTRVSLWSRCVVTWRMKALCDLVRIRARAASTGPVLVPVPKSVSQSAIYESAGRTVFRKVTGIRWNASRLLSVGCGAGRVPQSASGRHEISDCPDPCRLLHT
jgi:hypothetical protein